jgi:hypothetical protein
MKNNETQDINLEEMTNEELEAYLETQDNDDQEPDYKAELEKEKQRTATLQRLLNKKAKPEITKQDNNPSIQKDIEEIKFNQKIISFADDNKLSKKEAEMVLKMFPNATSETLQDPFVKGGLENIARQERVKANTPSGSNGKSTAQDKTYSEMSKKEREDWYAEKLQK